MPHAVPEEEGSETAGVLSAETIQNDASDYRDLSLRQQLCYFPSLISVQHAGHSYQRCGTEVICPAVARNLLESAKSPSVAEQVSANSKKRAEGEINTFRAIRLWFTVWD